MRGIELYVYYDVLNKRLEEDFLRANLFLNFLPSSTHTYLVIQHLQKGGGGRHSVAFVDGCEVISLTPPLLEYYYSFYNVIIIIRRDHFLCSVI